MAPLRKIGGRMVERTLQAADNTGGSKVGGCYVYDPNPLGTYDPTAEQVVCISVTPLAAFSKSADSFTLDVQRRDKAASTVGSAVTIWDGTATDGVAFVALNANAKGPIALNQGDTLSFTWTKAGNGSASIPMTVVWLFIGAVGA